MFKIYRVKKYTQFPKRMATDKVIRTVDNIKAAQIISIEHNKSSDDRFYVEEIQLLEDNIVIDTAFKLV